MADSYDLVVIGGGPGGYTAAIRAAQLGLKVACVEKRANKALGGVCLNVGCIPSKALLDSSEMYEVTTHKLARHGIKVGSVALDLDTMLKRKDKVVSELTGGVGFLFKKYGVTSIFGSAKLLAGKKIEVTAADGAKSVLEAKNVLLATGSESTELPVMKFDGKYIVSSTEALSFNPVPKHLIVVGGGYIGLELSSVWKRLGAKVTVIEFLPRILAISDGEVANEVHKLLVKQGFEFHLDTKVTGATVKGDSVTVTAQTKDGKELSIQGDRVLVAVGRRPYTTGLGLDDVGVKYDPKSGRVEVDGHFQTSVPGIFAIGDLIAGPMLAHKASEEGVVFAETLAGMKPHVNYDAIPSVIYIWPEVASVGLTEEQLKEKGIEYRTGKFKFSATGRAKAMDEQDGFVKVLADAKTDRVLGVHILGPRASDLIAECVTIMEYRGSAEDIARCTHAHPTLSEAVGEAARMAWAGKPLNS
ncbi:dihydrolipoamide dehydrogenase : Dihydrolipoyl dehydrogenase OS=Singulisphaera acidiphila (strain ATCC BAA-1392 / DSM 18658 / VKM B-2454 / MOB10) GN=Sinac_6538 PE=3 SV=1: Pyr_redox_2: Pyr_redox: Pyr_redox_dim [Gemmata massiliana]|uniref:Dihydrolipoyl dehydrogenase n=1 Tax=Gemmata massiliana TaxID=1210884 RepID=A0A6P2DI88_9BACT|nr:dihydrolipoyl dehydrogenase [Gemmata massiliana]VTS02661.1 dihydrolipoamide dehydrogenase : Dihydrolipoyl dehydrogenase OS=Singulisphaera acidiphila (strain ATCC BAA-1392 / DSM 18658 / VKM B-2454 / MOB10) GN=Sinac_6538 PE=3 SV=1: Pyr_redox_2: Pyr_redox: Pyr_redox_dim [Gemmata massiliana]